MTLLKNINNSPADTRRLRCFSLIIFIVINLGILGNCAGEELNNSQLICNPTNSGQLFLRGDADNSGAPALTGALPGQPVIDPTSINLTDPIFILNFLFLNGAPPPIPDSADSNKDGKTDLSDAVFLLQYLFSGGPAPFDNMSPEVTSRWNDQFAYFDGYSVRTTIEPQEVLTTEDGRNWRGFLVSTLIKKQAEDLSIKDPSPITIAGQSPYYKYYGVYFTRVSCDPDTVAEAKIFYLPDDNETFALIGIVGSHTPFTILKYNGYINLPDKNESPAPDGGGASICAENGGGAEATSIPIPPLNDAIDQAQQEQIRKELGKPDPIQPYICPKGTSASDSICDFLGKQKLPGVNISFGGDDGGPASVGVSADPQQIITAIQTGISACDAAIDIAGEVIDKIADTLSRAYDAAKNAIMNAF